ncbi:MAG: hypothetical protein EVG15_03980 [Candidatus Acididesulfobacter diazotrophicus]|uniref:DNA methylase N-4/N-6 domain-containing protein n=1 Tax=Candidatus Acididesulfobacter diazotrophicus TaxID=2597226 RepID=A0A519BNB4_9DELT|nr:MAG: hypothetical protein EVG15_03980 [Candidatus Acididesulfobacter diazotrophicus]
MDEKRGLIIDPYCGSGTTLIAAKILDHNFIGIEISKEYINLANQRLKNYKDEEKYAYEEIINRHIVKKTFKERKANGEFTGKYGNKKDNIEKSCNKELELFTYD